MYKSPPALANGSIHFLGSETIKWTSKNAYGKLFLNDLATHGPIVIFGTKCPSITSTWSQSAPH